MVALQIVQNRPQLVGSVFVETASPGWDTVSSLERSNPMQESHGTTESVTSIWKLRKRRYFVGALVQQIDAKLANSTWRGAPIVHQCFRSILQLLWLLRSPDRIYGFFLRPYPRALYRRWTIRYEALTPSLRSAMASDLLEWPYQPLISVILCNENVQAGWTNEAIRSVRNQIYPNWELCICEDPAATSELVVDPRVCIVVPSANCDGSINQHSALELAKGDYIAFLGSADLLSEDALFWVAREIVHHPEIDLLFSDEDRVDPDGVRLDPWFKSAWNNALMLSQNAFGRLGVYRREIVEKAGGLPGGYHGVQEHDLVLRCAERTTVQKIRHIPRVLYHRRTLSKRMSEKASNAARISKGAGRVVSDHLGRLGIRAAVNESPGGWCQVQYELPQPQPVVSIIVPSTLCSTVAAKCLTSVLLKSTYREFELLLLVNRNNMKAGQYSPDFAKIIADARVRIIQYDAHFNFSRVCNLGERAASGSILCFLNDDVEVITDDWLERLVSRGVLDGVGAVGPMLYYPNNTIQHAGVVLGIGGVAAHAFVGRPRGYPGYFGRACLDQDCSCVTGACVAIKRNVFHTVGGFDESLPVAFNDVDLCLKIRRVGARILWTPSVEMYHHESLTFGAHDTPQRLKQFLRDVEAMRRRWSGVLDSDPYYNPNLAASSEMYSLALPPRVSRPEQILAGRESISRTN